MEKEIKIGNCRIKVSGYVADTPVYSHETHGERFYSFFIESKRESGTLDVLPCVISHNMVERIVANQMVEIEGSIRTFNKKNDNGKNKLVLFVFVDSVNNDVVEEFQDINYVEIDGGFIAKQLDVRQTPMGRVITDFVVAINRTGGRSSYIPCIAWGRMAKLFYADYVGREVKCTGRLQSREYHKILEDGVSETMTAYELSVQNIEFMKEEEKETDENKDN